MHARGLTAYAIAKRSSGRISISTAYRLVEMEGRLETFGADILEALCDVLAVEPDALFERNGEGRATGPAARNGRPAAKRQATKPKTAKPKTAKPKTAKPTVVTPATVAPAPAEPAVAEPAVAQPAVAEPAPKPLWRWTPPAAAGG
jgi:hypothetical protein